MQLPDEKEKIINEYKGFIYKYTCHICSKKLDWRNDDELSIALIAFNEAIDKYDNDSRMSFLGYTKLVIKNRLIDYFRQENKYKNISLDDKEDGFDHPIEIKTAFDTYKKEIERRDREFEMIEFENLVKKFGITFSDLVNKCPNHKDTREKLHEIALIIHKDIEIIDKLNKTKKLPIKKIKKITGVSRKVIETWRIYLISLLVILNNDELSNLKSYIYKKKGGVK